MVHTSVYPRTRIINNMSSISIYTKQVKRTLILLHFWRKLICFQTLFSTNFSTFQPRRTYRKQRTSFCTKTPCSVGRRPQENNQTRFLFSAVVFRIPFSTSSSFQLNVCTSLPRSSLPLSSSQLSAVEPCRDTWTHFLPCHSQLLFHQGGSDLR